MFTVATLHTHTHTHVMPDQMIDMASPGDADNIQCPVANDCQIMLLLSLIRQHGRLFDWEC